MTITAPDGHCKWFKRSFFWGSKANYSPVIGYDVGTTYKDLIFNYIKRK